MNTTNNTRAFDDACYDSNTTAELREGIATYDAGGQPWGMANDCEAWELTPLQWREALALALAELGERE